MKKLLVGSLMLLAIGTAVYARPHDERYRDDRGTYHHSMRHRGEGRHCGRRTPESEKSRILIDEKRLEIRKELLNEKPDWNKIEKLNSDIALERARNKTEHMKYRFENDRLRPMPVQLPAQNS